MVTFGAQIWRSYLEVQFGSQIRNQIWESNLEVKFGGQISGSDSESTDLVKKVQLR